MLWEMQLTPLRLLLGKVVDSVVSDMREWHSHPVDEGKLLHSRLTADRFPPFSPRHQCYKMGEFISSVLFLQTKFRYPNIIIIISASSGDEGWEYGSRNWNKFQSYISICSTLFLWFETKRRQNHECGKYRVIQGIERNRCFSSRSPWWHAIGPNSSEWPIDMRSVWKRILKSAIFCHDLRSEPRITSLRHDYLPSIIMERDIFCLQQFETGTGRYNYSPATNDYF